VFVARQPIFDTANRRVAYELLYRANEQATSADGISQDAMCSDTALHAVVSIGLDRLTGGVSAFVNVSRDHLVGELYRVFDPTTVVLELLESIDGDPDVVAACEQAVANGYTLALDDYDARPGLDALLPFVQIVKLDVLNRSAENLRPVVTKLRQRNLRVLAERVEDEATRVMCRDLGCELFQGYVFSRPETLGGRTISLQQTAMLNVMGLLNDPRVGDAELQDAFRSHPSLTLALLRIVNSASFGTRNVVSIPHAIQLIGRDSLSRWLMVMFVASLAHGNPLTTEIVFKAMIRGRFSELLTLRGMTGDPAARFLVGLLSCIDGLLGQPMESVLERLPVNQDVRNALLLNEGPHAPVLSLVQAYESGDWEYVDRVQDLVLLHDANIADVYGESVDWARARLE
jgi:EAL and modified HD-GYP domain-containing signal transduction protein